MTAFSCKYKGAQVKRENRQSRYVLSFHKNINDTCIKTRGDDK